jgi:predicted Zn finger-like uncharacterized protein
MTDQGARCPQCQISFRVTLPQLRAAGGLVRCGFCLVPFDAYAHRVALTPQSAPEDPLWRRDTDPWRIDDGFDRARLEAFLGPHPGAGRAAPERPQAPAPPPARAEAPAAPAAVAPPPHWLVTPAAPRRPRRSAAVLSAGIALVLLQGLYFHADLLAGQPLARPVYRVLCALAPCRFGAPETGPGIQVENVVVRPLPPAALRLEAMLANRAAAPRPLPALRVEFEDLQGAVVAGRTFAPDQYLAGGVRALAGGQSLHLRLELRDPGPAAVSYQVIPVE